MPPGMGERFRQIEKRLARLEGNRARRAYAGVTNPLPGAVPEIYFSEQFKAPVHPEPATLMPFPGVMAAAPFGCNLVVLNPTGDPVVVAGSATPAALIAMRANPLIMAALAGGGMAIMDALTGTTGIIIDPVELTVNVVGTLLNNGAPLP